MTCRSASVARRDDAVRNSGSAAERALRDLGPRARTFAIPVDSPGIEPSADSRESGATEAGSRARSLARARCGAVVTMSRPIAMNAGPSPGRKRSLERRFGLCSRRSSVVMRASFGVWMHGRPRLARPRHPRSIPIEPFPTKDRYTLGRRSPRPWQYTGRRDKEPHRAVRRRSRDMVLTCSDLFGYARAESRRRSPVDAGAHLRIRALGFTIVPQPVYKCLQSCLR